jgi:hypothetical protein
LGILFFVALLALKAFAYKRARRKFIKKTTPDLLAPARKKIGEAPLLCARAWHGHPEQESRGVDFSLEVE